MTRAPQRGFTLIELIIFIVVVSAGMAGILAVMNTVVKSSADPMLRKQAMAIAESMLEEILLKDYPDGSASPTVCPAVAGVRRDWMTVCDYNGYTTSAGIVMPDQASTPVDRLERFNLKPPVKVIASTDLTGVAALKVTVSVTDPTGGVVQLSGYRSCYSAPPLTCPP